MAGTLDAPDGDTAYVLTTPPTGAVGFVLECGNHADGEFVWIANVDPNGTQINVEWHGSHEGVGSLNLSAKGDTVFLPMGDITRIIVRAASYPATIGWAYVPARATVRTGLVAAATPSASGGVLPVPTGPNTQIAGQTGAAAAISATLTPNAGQTEYLTGFEVTGAGATAASVITVTVVGLLGGTRSYKLAIPAGAAVGVPALVVEFIEPLPASAAGVAIVVNVPSFGAGNTDAAVVAHGFSQ